MARRKGLGWEMYLIAPPILVGMALGIWISLTAAYENIRMAHATNQVLTIVSMARTLIAYPSVEPSRLTDELYTRLSQIGMGASQVQALDGSGQTKGVLTPWQDPVVLSLWPAQGIIRLETRLPVRACRQMLAFWIKTGAGIGLRDVQVLLPKTAIGPSGWTVLFTPETGAPKQEDALLRQGCAGPDAQTLAFDFAASEPGKKTP